MLAPWIALVALLVAPAAPKAAVPAADDMAEVKQSALDLYDKGSYAEARPLLEQLDAARLLDGPMLYRLFFCEKAAGHPEDAREALERARDALSAASAAAPTLETSFYLANAYGNLGRAQEAKDTARDATSKVEAGKIPAPTSAIAQFQLGKLYQDQGRPTEAVAQYKKAVSGFDLKNGRYAGNARWALRYIATTGTTTGDFASAEDAFAKLTGLGGADASDWDGLATARVRQRKYAEAGEAWRAAVSIDPANADDARYAARLAEQAVSLAPLPDKSATGTSWASMTQTDLESTLKAEAAAAAETVGRGAATMKIDGGGAATVPCDPKLRKELEGALRQTRQRFVAAGLEYAARHLGIRETAFREGYAVAIFQERAWQLPPDPSPPGEEPPQRGS